MLVIPPATARLLMPPPKYKNIIDKMYEIKQEDLAIKSIAIPFLGAGVGGLRPDELA